MASYDIVLWFFSLVVHTFFRDIRPRGTFNIPSQGPIVFVIAPHHNQFVDPLVVMAKVKENSGRRISYLAANKSYQRKFIGTAAMLCGAIPVERAQDLLKLARGTIRLQSAENKLQIVGEGTQFTKDCMPKGLLGLPESLGNCPIKSIEDDTHLTLKEPFESANKKLQGRLEELLLAGTRFKSAPHVDNHTVFYNVFNHLNSGKALGIFPEGGSHDRPDLLPLKPGVAIMALGAVASLLKEDPDAEVTPVAVVPVGLNYFHPNKFRSRVVVEFGTPIMVDKGMAQSYIAKSRDAVAKLLSMISIGLKEVTVTSDDYDTLMVSQAARRLYTSGDRNTIPLPMVVEMNRRLIKGYEKHAKDPDVVELRENVTEYNRKLMMMGLHDHQVESLTSSKRLRSLIMFLERFFKFVLFSGLSMPGVVMFSPVFITAKKISRKKAKEALAGSVVKIQAKDVISTWKILVALVLAPILYIFYSVIGTIIIIKFKIVSTDVFPIPIIFLFCYGWALLTTYASLRVGEIGVDYYKSLAPLFISLTNRHKDVIQIDELKKTRRELSKKVEAFCNKYGPDMFTDYEKFYKEYNEQDPFAGHMDDESEKEDEKAKESDLKRQTSTSSLDSFNLNNLSDIPIFSNAFDIRINTDATPLDNSDYLEIQPPKKSSVDTTDISLRLRSAMKTKYQKPM